MPAAPSRIYFDVDGVINAPLAHASWGSSETVTIRENHGAGFATLTKVVWAPTLITALDELIAEFGVEVVWLSSWNDGCSVTNALVPKLRGLWGGRVIPYVEGGNDGNGWWKRDAIVKDQAGDNTPFIWVDDVEVRPHGPHVRKYTHERLLLLETNPDFGIRPADVARMRVFLESM